ncbi:hypothetical protein [Rhodoferax antarcticus]|uniref:Putative DNA methylase domain protein n=1 Tax=Rhodoferax antarcticus ANT.BR TaxID=1111071 RepID=A0A1Q8YEN3_9BURK|nr:hypothetical protein [Rhodoferax antarcticus]APW46318.1 hypothetical protein RA876_07930 [Rhodoferax antarcticus]OLP06534.1 putative DNA methylase domain protein [Rhodoferax antarcticus ANT.BR]
MAIESGGLEAPGLVAKQAIRAGANREVLTALCATTHIFNAWADEQWINDGAAERVSLVCFGTGGLAIQLNGQPVPHINADLTGVLGLDMTQAKALPENAGGSFEGTKKYGDFDVPGLLARQWLALPNPPWQVQCSGGQTFPFPLGLTPLVTAHQQTETLPNGAIIPLLTDFHIENVPQALTDKAQVATKTKAKTAACTSAAEVGVARMSGAPSNGEA